MNLKAHPTDIAATLLTRSVCAVQVAAVLVDAWGVHGWGWNHSGATGFGKHAEAHCMSRANRDRVERSTLYVAAVRKRNGKPVNARPCTQCQRLIKGVKRVVFRDAEGVWRQL
jgi:deoxycytidylate deaminase